MKCPSCRIPMSETHPGRFACPCCGVAVKLRDPAIDRAIPVWPPMLRVEEYGWEQDEDTLKHAKTYPAQVCIGAGCGLEFIPRAGNQKRCLSCSAEMASRRKSLTAKVCQGCGDEYAPKSGTQKRCTACAVLERRKDVTGARPSATRLTAALRRAS